ncbi:cation transport ATPase [Cytobacillus eiseniae]|uniref:Cation transport ATPase n=1 Tax=Cytobacillus eiseniae TaxID=762947 RepID=A0ABS4R9M2_9BACI|nr:hypothetical protein [Cytobacillus eiseniae]MBP2239596.1 cation transport ATPase [Cytobacillus eiseniae]
MKLNVRSSLWYLAFTVGFIILLLLISRWTFYFETMFRNTFQMYPWIIYIILLNIPIGIYLGIPSFFNELKKQGRWRVNIGKLLFIGLPMALLAFFMYFPMFNQLPEFLVKLVANPNTMIYFRLGTIVTGYILITSLIKEEKSALTV